MLQAGHKCWEVILPLFASILERRNLRQGGTGPPTCCLRWHISEMEEEKGSYSGQETGRA
jgi:hypothetical protein